jgi:primosomal protein N' (replication factor Y) (superfamily II helicase)
MLPPRVVRVALDVPNVEGYDFLIPPESPADLPVGTLVRVPFGRNNRERVGVVVEVDVESNIATERIKAVFGALPGVPPLPETVLALARFAADYYRVGLGEMLMALLPPGLRVSPPVIAKPATALWLVKAPDNPKQRAPKRDAVVAALTAGPRTLAALRDAVPHPEAVVRSLLQSGHLAARAVEPNGGLPLASDRHNLRPLTPNQAQAVAAIDLAEAAVHVLHGITGSGKTEVYLRLVAQVVASGSQALVLIPEIHLTPQLAEVFAERFGAAHIAVLHSGIAEGERSRLWLAIHAGQIPIVLGTRLAVFAPLLNLKLVIVDEEHDASYKQGEAPRYSARDLAVVRAQQMGIPVVLGSATPTLETYANARRGRYRLHTLSERAVAAAKPPSIHLVDTRSAKLKEGLAESVLMALAQCQGRGEQSLVFINRRGYAPTLACFNCGWAADCPRCDARSVFHRADRSLTCHQCGRREAVPQQCPTCGNTDIKPVGRGTQRLEAALQDNLPDARVLRMDRDSMARKDAFVAARERVRSGEVDVLVGTQMLAKGHDYPRLTLVVVVDADRGLYASDFRAPERMFAMLLQVAGRAGRAERPGQVLVQTDFPSHPVYAALVAQDYCAFAEAELLMRSQHSLPPASYLALLRAESRSADGAIGFLGGLAATAASLSQAMRLGVAVYDAVPALLARRADVHRAQLLFAARSRRALRELLDHLTQDLQRPSQGVRVWVDIDPQDL